MNFGKTLTCFCIALFSALLTIAQTDAPVWNFTDGNLHFTWNYAQDKARLINETKKSIVWQGSLLPAFWIKSKSGLTEYVHSQADLTKTKTQHGQLILALKLANWGTGTLTISNETWGVRFNQLTVHWAGQTPAIIEMYFGSSAVNQASLVHPLDARPFKPDWQSAGYCVPGAKGGTVQSFFRSWDFGQAEIALGNFGPSLGTPYGAAYPRPFLFAAMGSNDGWINIGSGELPDGALTLKIQSTKACFKYLYREDLWGALTRKDRVWTDPLRITVDQTALDAFGKYFASFPPKENSVHPKPLWNTWGMWRLRKYPLRPLADFGEKIQASICVLDDGWESAQGSGQPDRDRFPAFNEDLAYIRSKKMDIGVWETIGWISDTLPYGLGAKDLIVDQRGLPCKTNWNFDEAGQSYFCLDISSEKVKAFLRKRTIDMMNTIHPSLIKLDFGYALPSPNMGVPRNPDFRGERYSFALLKVITDAARSVDPGVTIMNYGTSPLFFSVTDIVSLDDQGDLWYEMRRGHAEWSIWATLIGSRGMAVTGSSSYNWDDDVEVLMNSAIIGVPGASLALFHNEGPVPESYINRRLALNKFCRRTAQWTPRWLNSHKGDLDGPPILNSWGREEQFGGEKKLTALTIRSGNEQKIKDSVLPNLESTGNWSIIAQDNEDIWSSKKLVFVPFSAATIQFPRSLSPVKITMVSQDGESPFTDWSWKDGKLSITVNENKFARIGAIVVE